MDKQQARQIIQDTFESRFDRGRYIHFLRELLNSFDGEGAQVNQGARIPEKFQDHVEKIERVGKYTDEKNEIMLFIVYLKRETAIERARTMQRNFVAWYLSQGEKDAALVAYVSPEQADWRFSLVKMDYKFEKSNTGKVKVREEFTPARRWSFLVGANEKSHTAKSSFENILSNDEHSPTLAELEKAFDIETVTKEFFLKYRELFLRTKEALDKVVKNDPKIKADFDAKGVDTVNFSKKLLGQIVFLYFLQKKGWFGVGRDDDWGTGSKHFMRQLFESNTGILACENNTTTDKSVWTTNFFNDILEPLFYEALRIDRSHDDDYYSRFNCKIPFLNGGLFDPIGNYDWVHTDIHLPDDLFSNSRKTKEDDIGDGILDVFDRYNFTVREDEPLEKEVAIDPELLGKAYEKFNAIRPDNFDEFTKALKSGKKGEENKFNKKFGVYYTPREIVHYMCKQSLINYLYTKVTQAFLPETITRQDIEDLIEVGELITEHEATALIKQEKIRNGIQKSTEYTALLSDSIRENAATIDRWLEDITVCDPAVGSGAFPVGMMNEIVRARNVLSVFFQSNSDGDTGIPACDKDSDTIHITRRNLPHWTKANAVYWITFRLADSLPQEKLNGWKAERDNWISKHRKPWSEKEWKEYDEQFGKRVESWLDSGYGSCVLAQPEIREIVQECLLRFNGERLLLHAGVIMPNHVHLLLEPLPGNSLSELLKGIKGASSRKINQSIGTTGTKFWMDESYDHIVRSEAQYQHFIRYIAENPIKANLSKDKYWLYEGNTGILACDNKITQTRMSVPHETTQTGKHESQSFNTQTGMSVLRLRSAYEFKRRCIEHSLYGVDIDPGAVEITKLRLWLSLVVDEEDIKNIKPLPNLDYKIVCGNSLLGVEKDLFNNQLFTELERLKPLYFKETNPTRKQVYKKQIDDLISKITNGHTEFDFEVYFSEVFHERGGFDVVIANPPYVRQEAIKPLKPHLAKAFGAFYCGTADIYTYFYKCGTDLMRPSGHLCFIAPNKFMRAGYGKNTRTLLTTQVVPKLIIDFGDLPIFDATTYPSIILAEKRIPAVHDQSTVATFREADQLERLDETLDKISFAMPVAALGKEGWNLEQPEVLALMEKLKSCGKPLGEYVQGRFYRGILTGLNDAFVVDAATRENLITEDPKSAELIKPWLRGRDIGKWEAVWDGLYVIFTRRGTDIEKYSAIKRHLEQFRLDLEPKKSDEDKRGRKPGTYKWFEIQDNIAYYEEFEGPKIIWGNMATSPKFAFDNEDFYISAPANLLPASDTYLVGLLNSSICKWLIAFLAAVRGGNFLEFKPMYVEQIPVFPATNKQKVPIIERVEKILADPDGSDIPRFEKEIDRLVYELYGLTEEEIKIVEESS